MNVSHTPISDSTPHPPIHSLHSLCIFNSINVSFVYVAFVLPTVAGFVQLPYEYDDGSMTNGWHISYAAGLASVFCRAPGLDVELTLGASDRHLASCGSAA